MKKFYNQPVLEIVEYEGEVLSNSGAGTYVEDNWSENNQLI